ncbi:SpoIIE family protein phosphatase [Streptomyces sp. NPDC001852]|uniref:SpoIIE family protein phosphatase n=1 Tax=Streptomyces sp. NPDC001852 TaxID=3364619 RepID=UPI003684F46E
MVDLPAGPPLGLGSLPFEATELTLPEKSLLALFTDGLVTAGGRDFDDGVAALRSALARPAASLEALADTVLDTVCPGPHDDDIALLLARTQVGRPAHPALGHPPHTRGQDDPGRTVDRWAATGPSAVCGRERGVTGALWKMWMPGDPLPVCGSRGGRAMRCC